MEAEYADPQVFKNSLIQGIVSRASIAFQAKSAKILGELKGISLFYWETVSYRWVRDQF